MKTVRYAIKQTVPILFSYIFVGMAFGLLMHEAGYSVLWSFLSGVFIYAGSMQLIMVPLLTAGVPPYMIALMTLFINARHVFYGLGFISRFRAMGWKYPYMILTLTDETYSIFCAADYPSDIDAHKADFTTALSCHVTWILSCTAGALLGQALPFSMAGIEFSATAFFTAVCVNQWRQFRSHLPAIMGFLSAVLFYFLLGPDRFILPALSVSLVVLVVLRDSVSLKLRGENNAE